MLCPKQNELISVIIHISDPAYTHVFSGTHTWLHTFAGTSNDPEIFSCKVCLFLQVTPSRNVVITTINTNATNSLIVHDFAISFNCPALKLICSLQWVFTNLTYIKYQKEKKKKPRTQKKQQPKNTWETTTVMFCFSHIVTATNPNYTL